MGEAPLSVSDFCNVNKKIQKHNLRSGYVMGRQISQPNVISAPKTSRTPGGRDYVRQYVEQEEQALLHGLRPDLPGDVSLSGPRIASVCEMEDITSAGSVANLNDVVDDSELQLYDRYDFSPKLCQLPIMKAKEKIVRMIETNQVVIILGATGCGKTTQVPQFILDEHARARKRCNIIVTQPRRIAATSVAKRVCDERGWELSTIVGYQIGLNNKTSPDTRLTYCTTGVLREKLVRERNMMAYTHVIIDEVHERDLETDFIMLIVRKLLRTNSRQVKVILMSATIDPSHFATYFSLPIGRKLDPAPVIEVEKETNFKVTAFYINQLKQLGDIPHFEIDDPLIPPQSMDIAVRLIMYFDKIDYLEFEDRNGRPPTKKDCYKPAVLVFLPGIHEIETMHELLEQRSKAEKYFWHKIPLHSSIAREEQKKVFEKPAEGYRKIILSTNIAESSITVPDVVYVIDFCLTKHLVCNPDTNFSSLRYAWASHANCKQRAGRAGRVRDGRVYRMVPQNFFEQLPEESVPEMIRCPLTLTVLKAKLLKMGGPKGVLALALDPPDLTRLETTILELKEVGALLMTCEGKVSKYDGDITFLGTVMSHLPLDIQFTRMIMLGHVFSILEDAIVMAAWMSVRNVFRNDFHDRLGPYASRISFTGGSSSDCIAYLHAYQMFTEKKRTNYFRTSNDSDRGWCKRNFLHYNAMCEANELVDELRARLKNLGVYELVNDAKRTWDDTFLPLIRKVVIAGAVYPNYFVRGSMGGQIDEPDAVKVLSGRDPYSTVYLQGLPQNQPGELYAKNFKDIFEEYAGVVTRVSCDNGCSKVFIEFAHDLNTNLPGKISYPVYRAIKMRQLRIPIVVPCLQPDAAWKRINEKGKVLDPFSPIEEQQEESHVSRLPGYEVQYINFDVSWHNNPNKFYIHQSGVEAELESVQLELNTPGNLFVLSTRPVVNGIYAAPYATSSGTDYYRAKVLAISKEPPHLVKVLFIDYGNVEFIPWKQLFEIGESTCVQKVPPLASPCTLTEIAPPPLQNNGQWSEKAIKEVGKYLSHKSLLGEVYSVVDGVLSLIVRKQKEGRSINDVLVEKDLAVKVEESYRSKSNYSRRVMARDKSNCPPSASSPKDESSHKIIDIQDIQHNFDKDVEYLIPPSKEECRNNQMKLRGPSSPLEMKVHGCTRNASGREISIDPESVNAVLLDANPEDPHERLLVAGHVIANPGSSRLRLSHTTLMPNLHGLSALMSLIFSPTMELRLSQDKKRYIGALCGLGYDEVSGDAYFPEHDMEITFDCEIDVEDIKKINILRFYISKPLETAESEDMGDATPAEIKRSQQRIMDVLIPLLSRFRRSQEIETFPRPLCWRKYDPADLLEPDIPARRSVFPPHFGLKIREDD